MKVGDPVFTVTVQMQHGNRRSFIGDRTRRIGNTLLGREYLLTTSKITKVGRLYAETDLFERIYVKADEALGPDVRQLRSESRSGHREVRYLTRAAAVAFIDDARWLREHRLMLRDRISASNDAHRLRVVARVLQPRTTVFVAGSFIGGTKNSPSTHLEAIANSKCVIWDLNDDAEGASVDAGVAYGLGIPVLVVQPRKRSLGPTTKNVHPLVSTRFIPLFITKAAAVAYASTLR